MSDVSFGVHVSFASVDREGGGDPREAARRILVRQQIPGAVRDAGAAWGDDDEEAVLLVPVTDDGRVLTLTPEHGLETTLTAGELRAAFADAGLNLPLPDAADDTDAADGPEGAEDDGSEDHVEAADDEHPLEESELVEDIDDAAVEEFPDDAVWDDELFAPEAVRVSSFSRRGPTAARLIAQANGIPVSHVESGTWSLQSYASADATIGWPAEKAEGPVIELNQPDRGLAWAEVTVPGANGITVPFWIDAERDTVPVIHPDDITQPATALIVRSLLTEGDSSRDELAEIADRCALDVDAAHSALIAEALGGVRGADARTRAFLGAFGVPGDLIDIALAEPGESGGSAAVPGQAFAPTGWARTIDEVLIGGMADATPLTRRERPLARLSRTLSERPAVGLVISAGELVLGAWLSGRASRGARAVGVLLVIDAVVDAVIGLVRLRRRR